MQKRLPSIFLVCLMLVSLVGCGSATSEPRPLPLLERFAILEAIPREVRDPSYAPEIKSEVFLLWDNSKSMLGFISKENTLLTVKEVTLAGMTWYYAKFHSNPTHYEQWVREKEAQ